MNIKRANQNGAKVAVIEINEVIISDVQSALDLMATVRYETECDRIAAPKSAVVEDFFVLSTGIVGEIMQKFVNYQCKLAILGTSLTTQVSRSVTLYTRVIKAVIFFLWKQKKRQVQN